jgi:hypothetical protein
MRPDTSLAEGGWASLRGAWADGLYPLTPKTSRVEGLVVFVLASALALFRLPLRRLDTLWAEDGVVFLRQAEESPAFGTVFRPYSGYLHALPRLVSELAGWLPLPLAGLVFSLAAALVVGAAAWSVWVYGRAHLPSPWLRGALAAVVALVPAGGLEAVDNVANSHWFLVFAAFWALLGRPPSARGQVVPAIIVALAALSDPLAVVLLPLALGRLLLLRGRDRWVTAAYALAMIAQLLVVLSADRTTGARPALADIAFGYSLRVVLASLVGLGGAGRLFAAGGRELIWTIAVSVAVALATATLLVGRHRFLVVAAAVASVAFFVMESLFALKLQYPPTGSLTSDLNVGSRYTIVPALLLLAALAVAAQGIAERLPGRWPRPVLIVALTPVVLIGLVDYRAEPGPRDQAPTWWESVREAVADCSEAPPDQVERLLIAPNEPWAVELTCRTLAGD